jgi:PRC-barrel domain
VSDLGPPIAYPRLQEGTPVYDRTGTRVGVVERVVADEPVEIFRGLVIRTLPPPGRRLFADADQAGELHERGVVLSVTAGDLPEARESRSRAAGAGGPDDGPAQALLRRVSEWLRGEP